MSRSRELRAPDELLPTAHALSAVLEPTADSEVTATAVSISPTPTATPLPPSQTPTSSPTATALPTVIPTALATATLPPSPTATPDNRSATAVFNSSIFADHDVESEELGIVRQGESVTVLGRSPVGQWFFVESDEGVRGFTFAERYVWNGRFEELPVVEE